MIQHRIHIEATYKGKASMPSVYMEAAVLDILPAYDRQVVYSRLDIQSEAGRQRFLELSCSLFGEKAVYDHHRLAPIPGLFMDGELVFDAIPSRDELEDAITEKLSEAEKHGAINPYEPQRRNGRQEKK